MDSLVDTIVPVQVGNRVEIVAAGTAILNLLGAFFPPVAAALPVINTLAPYFMALFAAARASRK